MAKRNPKWHREMKRAVEAAGCEVVQHGPHPKIMKDGVFVAAFPGSVSDWRGLKNLQTTLRRAGVDITVPKP